jgi:prepilin-type N-terminal cleavage/methylation domain-containing protein
MSLFPNKKTKKAFSLTEISIVITIIGIIIAGIIGSNFVIKKFSIDIASKRPKTAESVIITFTPQLKDNLILWLDAANKNSFSQDIIDQDQISYWKSVNFLDTTYKITQNNQTNMPTYHEYGINNLPAIYFDGNDFLLKNNLNSQLTKNKSEITIFTVLTLEGYSAYIYDLYNPSTNILFSSQINNNYSSTSSNIKLSYGSTNDASNSSNHESLFDKDKFLKPQIITMIRRNDISQILVNNSNFGNNSSSNNSNLPNNVVADFYLGSKNNSSLFFNGYIAELIIFNKGLSDDQITHINKYLSKKWQIKLY